jgi:hypothetical protein
MRSRACSGVSDKRGRDELKLWGDKPYNIFKSNRSRDDQVITVKYVPRKMPPEESEEELENVPPTF